MGSSPSIDDTVHSIKRLWLTNTKRYFSKSGYPAISIGEKYVSCDVTRQGLLELALKWISHNNVEQYKADH